LSKQSYNVPMTFRQLDNYTWRVRSIRYQSTRKRFDRADQLVQARPAWTSTSAPVDQAT